MTTTYFKADPKDKRKDINEQCQHCGCAFNSHYNGRCPVQDDELYDRVEGFDIANEV
jgi:hypothetical protein